MIMKAFTSICLLSISMGAPNYEFKKLKIAHIEKYFKNSIQRPLYRFQNIVKKMNK